MDSLYDEATTLDHRDPLKEFRNNFHIPLHNKKEVIYFCGNSLGLQPKSANSGILSVLDEWKTLGVQGHFKGDNPWLERPDKVIELILPLVGAKHEEVVLMNALTVNLHLMLESFYRPTKRRYKILIEEDIFPSDYFAIVSHCRRHGFDPAEAIISVNAKDHYYPLADIQAILENQGDSIAVVLLPGVQYISGQVFDVRAITELAKSHGCIVGWDFAHSIGNVPMQCHKNEIDFAVWCHYKYMNAGPGAIGGAFIHERHLSKNLHRLQGWWGVDAKQRFEMSKDIQHAQHAQSWQVSNPSIIGLALLEESAKLFHLATFQSLQEKSEQLWNFMYRCLEKLVPQLQCITPIQEHGCQFALKFVNRNGEQLLKHLYEDGVVADWRGKDILRFAPVPMYNTFLECYYFANKLKHLTGEQ